MCNRERKGIKLRELIERSDIKVVSVNYSDDPLIYDITYDSRKVEKGSLYVAIQGTKQNGENFIPQAIEKGAVAIVAENPHPEVKVGWVQVKNARESVGILSKTLWNIEEKEIKFIGITGTNGKTTVSLLYESLLKEIYPYSSVWLCGTIEYHIEDKVCEASNTTPEACEIFKAIGNSTSKVNVVIMEVSSHSLALDRVGGILYDLAIFTNLTQDHLDFHNDMESYYLAKRKLFTEYLKDEGFAIVNIDNPYGKRLISEIKSNKVLTYGRDKKADIYIDKYECTWDGCYLEIVSDGKRENYKSKLKGFFNIYNMASLIAGAKVLGFNGNQIQVAFDKLNLVRGRFEKVEMDAPFTVIIDYAHTPDALQNVLSTAKQLTKGRLLCVFGCGGDRDRKKRPLMGEIVSKLADEAWVTSDNPRSEKPEDIISEIVDGIPLDFPHHTIVDRREAIEAALREARKDDCIVIAGKGHETYQEIKGVKYHFDDKEVVLEIYSKIREEEKINAKRDNISYN